MDMDQKQRFMIRMTYATFFVLALWLILWGVTGNKFFTLCATFTPFVTLTVLTVKAGLFRRNSSRTR